MKPAFPSFLALLVARAAAYAAHGPAPAPGPAAGPAAAPTAAVAALRMTFEIKNYNYFDLTRKTCPQQEQALNAAPKKKGKPLDIARTSGVAGAINRELEDMSKSADKLGENVAKGVLPGAEKAESPPWMEKKGASFLDTSMCVIQHNSLAAIHAHGDESCKTVLEVFRSAVKEVVRDVIKCTYNTVFNSAGGPASAPVAAPVLPPPVNFLQSSQRAPAAAAAVAAPASAGPPDVAIFATFTPGHEIGSGRTVIVEVTFTDKPENGVDDVALTNKILKYALDNGILIRELKTALEIITGITPKLGKVKMQEKAVEAWNVKKCEGHVEGIVESLRTYYTREQVPMAMYNACTDFMTRMSFSNDYVLDRMDTVVCRQTTAKFAKHWNFGEKAKPEDFQLMCVHACEAKFGKDAPQCNVEAGDGLAGKPLL